MVSPLLRAPSVSSAVGLVLANAVPLVGVIGFGWDLFGIMWLYWAENGIIGAYAFLRILTASGEGHGQKLFMAPFFTVHFGGFWLVHGAFVVSLFGDGRGPILGVVEGVPWEGLVPLMLSHGASLALNYLGRGEWREATPQLEMMRPYGRVVLLHVVLIAGGFFVGAAGGGVLALGLFVVLKTALDLGVHLVAHRRRFEKLAIEEAAPEATTRRLDRHPTLGQRTG